MASTKNARIAGFIVLAMMVLIVASFAFPWNLNAFRGWIGNKAQEFTGRRLAVDGNLTLYWGLFRKGGTHITAERLRFANPDWGKRPEMLTVERVDAHISLGELLKRRIFLPAVTVDRPDAQFEELEDGRRNWLLDKKQSDSKSSVQIGALTLNTGHIVYIADFKNTHVQADAATEKSGDANKIVAHATGKYNGLALDAKLRGDDVLRLRDTSANYGFELHVIAGQTKVDAKGSLAGLLTPVAADLQLAVAGASMDEWYRIAHVGLPETPPYRTAGHLSLKDGVWHYDNFTGNLGTSDLGGSLVFEPKGEHRPKRPLLSGKLTSKELDLKDLGPVIGKDKTADEAKEGTENAGGKTANRKSASADGKSTAELARTREKTAANDGQTQTSSNRRLKVIRPSVAANAKAEPTPRSGRVLPQQEFNTDKWDTLDADLELVATEIRNLASMPFDNLHAHLKLDDKLMLLTPLNFGFGNGELRNEVRLDGRTKPMKVRVDGQFRNVQLDTLLPKLKVSKTAFGNLNGKVNLEGRGYTVAQWLGTANGNVQLAMGHGTISNLLLELLDLDAGEALKFLISGDKTITIRCAIADLDFKDGVMTNKALIFDTVDTIIRGEGSANFADETLDMKIIPLPKDKSILAVRVPFTMRGTFGKPSISPDKTLLAARIGGAVLLGTLNPFAALLPLLETGPGKDSPCSDLLSRVSVPVKNVDVQKSDPKQDKPDSVKVTTVPKK